MFIIPKRLCRHEYLKIWSPKLLGHGKSHIFFLRALFTENSSLGALMVYHVPVPGPSRNGTHGYMYECVHICPWTPVTVSRSEISFNSLNRYNGFLPFEDEEPEFRVIKWFPQCQAPERQISQASESHQLHGWVLLWMLSPLYPCPVLFILPCDQIYLRHT